jgi:asparagine synthase (glutamine-hydrolysing)
MDALVALVAPDTERQLAAAVASMLDRLWPHERRADAIMTWPGVAIASSRTRRASEALGAPAVYQENGAFLVRRWDWQSLTDAATTNARLVDSSRASEGAPLEAMIRWNADRQDLTIQRDPLGEASFWYAYDGGRLAVASHPQPLFALEWVSDEPDPVRAQALWISASPGDWSPWRMIHRLPAGHRLIYRDVQVRVERWWRLSVRPIERSLDDREWVQRAREALERAVARRIPVAETVGAQLSGGLDSTATCLLAARGLSVQGRALHTFSHLPAVPWNPPQPGDETPYVEAALGRMSNAIPHPCTDEGGEGAKSDGSSLLAHDRSVRDAAHAVGVGCMLSGWGGDEGISYNGDGFLAGQLLGLHFPSVLRWCWEFGGRTPRGLLGVFLYKLIYQQLGFLRPTPVHPNPSRRSKRERLRGLRGEARTQALRFLRDGRRLRAAASAHENQRRLLTSPHIANRIDSDAEWSIPAGFCFRYPLLDPEVLEVALQVPERLMVLNGRTRTLLREAMRGLYPDLIQNRHGKFVSHPQAPVFRAVE